MEISLGKKNRKNKHQGINHGLGGKKISVKKKQ